MFSRGQVLTVAPRDGKTEIRIYHKFTARGACKGYKDFINFNGDFVHFNSSTRLRIIGEKPSLPHFWDIRIVSDNPMNFCYLDATPRERFSFRCLIEKETLERYVESGLITL
jgi:hypothetical protein